MVIYTIAAIDVQDRTNPQLLDNTMSSTASSVSYRSEQVMVLMVCSFDIPFRHKDGISQGSQGTWQIRVACVVQ